MDQAALFNSSPNDNATIEVIVDQQVNSENNEKKEMQIDNIIIELGIVQCFFLWFWLAPLIAPTLADGYILKIVMLIIGGIAAVAALYFDTLTAIINIIILVTGQVLVELYRNFYHLCYPYVIFEILPTMVDSLKPCLWLSYTLFLLLIISILSHLFFVWCVLFVLYILSSVYGAYKLKMCVNKHSVQ